jgi:hypothetical protein
VTAFAASSSPAAALVLVRPAANFGYSLASARRGKTRGESSHWLLRWCHVPLCTVERDMPSTRFSAALAVCAIALAACGSSSKPSSTGSADTQAVKYANCMRANGTPRFPDPGSNGALPNPASPAFRAAKKACANLQPVALHLHGPPSPSAAELQAARAFARCMRAHGFPQFPDPWTTAPTATGPPDFTLGTGEYFPALSMTEVQSPAFIQAAKACGVRLPTGPPP